jgi:hypothetical protein
MTQHRPQAPGGARVRGAESPEAPPADPAAPNSPRRRADGIERLRTWQLAEQLVAAAPDLVPVGLAPAFGSGVRLLRADRSVDIALHYDGGVELWRPLHCQVPVSARNIRSLGTARLAAAHVAAAAMCARSSPQSASDHTVAPIALFVLKHPEVVVVNGHGWVRSAGGLRSGSGPTAQWLRGRVPIDAFDTGPLPELDAGAWFWLAVDRRRRIVDWWTVHPEGLPGSQVA